MKNIKILLGVILFLGFTSCQKNNLSSDIAWDESVNGQLSGDLSQPTQIEFQIGDNRIVAGSVPHTEMECATFIGGPPDPVIPYMPNHESYTDVFTFTIPENATLSSIIVEKLEVTEIHSFNDYPCLGAEVDNQLGAFTGINNSVQIDWNSNSVIEFISLPIEHPLVGIGFAKTEGEDLMTKYRDSFPIPNYNINSTDLVINEGDHTFWWKDGANEINYTLNFIVTRQ
jgi:hypothetical protein